MTIWPDFGLRVQEARSRDALLAVCHLASARSEDGWFVTSSASDLYYTLRVPLPSNLSRDIRRLADADLLMSRRDSGQVRWSLTPIGQREATQLWSNSDEWEATAAPASDALPAFVQPLVPPELAPAEWSTRIAGFNAIHPFESNVFLMTRFPSREDDDLSSAMDRARDALSSVGLVLHVASDTQIVDDLWGNVAAHIWASKYGMAFVEGNGESGLNTNMLIELGCMIALGRRCLILKDSGSQQMPTDLLGRIYQPVNFLDLSTISSAIDSWVRTLPDLNR